MPIPKMAHKPLCAIRLHPVFLVYHLVYPRISLSSNEQQSPHKDCESNSRMISLVFPDKGVSALILSSPISSHSDILEVAGIVCILRETCCAAL